VRPLSSSRLALPPPRSAAHASTLLSLSDLRYIAGKRLLAEKYAAAGQPVFSYRFNQPAENTTLESGVPHFQEVAYVFGVPYKTANTLGTRPGDKELSRLMMSQWISFIHDGTPNNHGSASPPSLSFSCPPCPRARR